jgi:hypothetical protein
MGALVRAHGDTVAAYLECQRRHAAAVSSYEALRRGISGEVK